MLYISSVLSKYSDFKKQFQEEHKDIPFLDLSRIPSATLADECGSVVSHHSKCSVFLGYLEPGWMIEPTHQTRIRKLFRKFDVAIVTFFPESLPFSWKNEINTFYTDNPLNQNGNSNSIDNGGAIQDQSKL